MPNNNSKNNSKSRQLLLAEGWNYFSANVISDEAPFIQRREMRVAFYGGAQVLMARLAAILTADTLPTVGDLEMLAGMQRELEEFIIQQEKFNGTQSV